MAFSITSVIVVPLLATYLGIVQLLRFRRVRDKHRIFQYPTPSAITLEDAQKIQFYLFEVEFPFTAQKALEFALFRTYGIPTISSLLLATKQFSTKEHSSKRLADTAVIMLEIISQPPGSTRSTEAISRMNYLHSLYLRSGKIFNDDLLYTLGLFLLEPIRWINRYEWRTLTEQEMTAMGVFWASVGRTMHIDFSVLPSAKQGWVDGSHFMREIEGWSMEYEMEKMVPAQSNKDTADHTTALLLYSVPARFKPVGLEVVSALMDERLRRAMLYEAPPSSMQKTVDTAFHIRKLVLRHLVLPRPHFLRKIIISEKPDAQGRLHRLIWDQEPWYVEATFANRWLAFQSWIDWLGGRPRPGDEGDRFKPEGFITEEIGPTKLHGRGLEESQKDAEWIRMAMRGDSNIKSVKA